LILQISIKASSFFASTDGAAGPSAGKEVDRETIISARDRDPTIWAVNHALKPEARHKVTLVGSCTIIIVIIVHALAAAYAA